MTRAEIAADIRRMKAHPVRLERPILVLAGWRSPHTLAYILAQRLRRMTGAEKGSIAWMSYPFASDIFSLAERAARFSREKLAPDGGKIDVVAVSMGGLVARAAALPEQDPRLNIARLFTLGTPHRGAKMAAWIRVDRATQLMKPGSDFLARLDTALEHADFELFPYAVLGDWLVGARNSCPPGRNPIWFKGHPMIAHYTITHHMPIVVDIARRLRGEDPIAHPSLAPRD